MWTLIKAVLLKWVLATSFGRFLALALAVLLPLAGILKVVGLPVLIVMAVLALPLFLLLGAIGLPVAIVVFAGGALLATVFAALTIGLWLLKVALPIILLVLFFRWLAKRPWGRGGESGGGGGGSTTGPSAGPSAGPGGAGGPVSAAEATGANPT